MVHGIASARPSAPVRSVAATGVFAIIRQSNAQYSLKIRS
jgi:hypothetical protein